MNVLISAVLLIAVVLVVATIFMNWATGLTKKQTTQISNKSLECTTTDITIESIFIDLGGNTSRVTVRNSGFSDDTITDAAFLAASGQAATNLTVFPITFPQGSIKTLEFNISGKIAACANFSRAIVSTKCTSDDQSRPLTCG